MCRRGLTGGAGRVLVARRTVLLQVAHLRTRLHAAGRARYGGRWRRGQGGRRHV